MELTREECIEALHFLNEFYDGIYGNDFYNSNEKLEQLIKEHFELKKEAMECKKELDKYLYNPPLKFEELKEDMWVWDNKYKRYLQCSLGKNVEGIDCICYESYVSNEGEFDEDFIEFEENRFYRYEVKENG